MFKLTPFLMKAKAISASQGPESLRRFLKRFKECSQCGHAVKKKASCVCGATATRMPRPQQSARYKALKDEVFCAYGGYICACCGEQESSILTIDHIENNGAAHRKAMGQNTYNWLKMSNFPPGFQVLCYNCNLGKYRNGGTCYHQLALRKHLSK